VCVRVCVRAFVRAAMEHYRPHKTTPALEAVRELVRTKVAPLTGDRHMSPDLDAVWELIRTGQIRDAVEPFLK